MRGHYDNHLGPESEVIPGAMSLPAQRLLAAPSHLRGRDARSDRLGDQARLALLDRGADSM